VQRVTSAQPLLVSVGTHLPPQAFVPLGHAPSTHELPLQTTVPPVGHPAAEHVVAPHPYVGSPMATQRPPHSL
jgi:hypothetical protein